MLSKTGVVLAALIVLSTALPTSAATSFVGVN